MESISQLIAELQAAKKPVFLAGNGVRLGRGIDLLREFIELTRIPLLLTWKALDFLHDNHELNAGRPGAVASRYANFTQQTSDVFIGIGARFDFGQTAYRPDNVAPRALKTFVDIDAGFEVAPGDASDIEVANAHPWGSRCLVFRDGAWAATAPDIAEYPYEKGMSC